jgi:uncharacterized membrane protein
MKNIIGSKEIRRWPALDAARGCLLIFMFAYHIVWNLGYFELVARSVLINPNFHAFSHAIAAGFIALSGSGLTLAARGGLRLRSALRRISVIALAAAAISFVTYLIFPDDFIFFGILHLIALASLCALPFLLVPAWLVVVVAAIAIYLPTIAVTPILDDPIWCRIGLGTVEPRTNDWLPFLPWFGVMLVGLLLGRAILIRGLPFGLESWRPRNAASKMLAFAGRHSLLIYLLHQPIFLALIFVIATLIRPIDASGARSFDNRCARECTSDAEASEHGRSNACATCRSDRNEIRIVASI